VFRQRGPGVRKLGSERRGIVVISSEQFQNASPSRMRQRLIHTLAGYGSAHGTRFSENTNYCQGSRQQWGRSVCDAVTLWRGLSLRAGSFNLGPYSVFCSRREGGLLVVIDPWP
jgi:hypothetical protein